MEHDRFARIHLEPRFLFQPRFFLSNFNYYSNILLQLQILQLIYTNISHLLLTKNILYIRALVVELVAATNF